MQDTKIQRPPLKYIFLSSDEVRLRAGWRIFFQTLVMVVLGLCISLPVTVVLMLIGVLRADSQVADLGIPALLPLQVAEFLMITLSIYLARRWFDRRSFVSLGVSLNKRSFFDALAGVLISSCIMGFIYSAEFAMGWVKFHGFSWQVEPLPQVIQSSLAFAFIFILTGWNEELISRGYYLINLSEGLGRFWGVLLSSAVFGLAHIGNPNASWVATFGIFMGGLFFAYSCLGSGQLWLPIGLHIGWNFSQGVIFGFPVSGLGIYPLTRVEFAGPVLWSGGAFGPEAGLILFPGLLLGFVLTYLYLAFLRRNHES